MKKTAQQIRNENPFSPYIDAIKNTASSAGNYLSNNITRGGLYGGAGIGAAAGLASAVFGEGSTSDRLKRFLKYMAIATAAGAATDIARSQFGPSAAAPVSKDISSAYAAGKNKIMKHI